MKHRLADWLFLVFVLIHSLGYWGFARARFPREPVAAAAVFRDRDITYYPFADALGRLEFGEVAVKEHVGQGVLSFPLAALLPYAVPMRLFGAAGLIVADVLVNLLFYAAVRWLLRVAGVGPLWASGFACLAATTGLQAGLGHLCTALHLNALTVWDLRIPRYHTTALLTVVVWAALLETVRANGQSRGWWVALAASLAALIQADIYSAFVVALLLPWPVWIGLRSPNGRAPCLTSLAMATLVGAVLSVPFALQRLYEHPDVPRRFGVFAVSRLHPIMSITRGMIVYWLGGMSALGVASFALNRIDPEGSSRRRPTWWLFAALTTLHLIALPLWCVAAGKVVQQHHFPARLVVAVSYDLLLAAALLGDVLTRRWPKASAALLVLAAVGSLAGGLAVQRGIAHDPDTVYNPEPRSTDYRDCLDELVNMMGRLRAEGRDVLATTDVPVQIAWLVYYHGHSYCPEVFHTAIPDNELERRYLSFYRIVGASDDFVAHEISTAGIGTGVVLEMTAMKYQANAVYSFAPYDDYPPEQQVYIRGGEHYNWVALCTPLSERRRLMELYTTMPSQPFAALDVIVLTRPQLAAGLQPGLGYREELRNAYFTVWVRETP